MKKSKVFIATFVILISITILIYKILPGLSQTDTSIVSPVPKFLTLFTNNQVSTLDLSLPSLSNKISASFNKPEITAESALMFDTQTQAVLYSKNPTEKLPMASLTKVMTAIIALENIKKDNKYLVSGSDLVGEDSMGLEAGEVLTLNELLYGLLLHSGNDAAETIASNYTNGRESFIKAMNDKAKALGLKNTNFTNPTGLEGDGEQYTTTYDLLVTTKYALEIPQFRKIVSTFEYTIPQTQTHKEYFMENETNLLTTYPGVRGVKTGFTNEAGLCLITYLDYKNHKIIGILLGSSNRRAEMIELLDYSLKSLGITPPEHG